MTNYLFYDLKIKQTTRRAGHGSELCPWRRQLSVSTVPRLSPGHRAPPCCLRWPWCPVCGPGPLWPPAITQRFGPPRATAATGLLQPITIRARHNITHLSQTVSAWICSWCENILAFRARESCEVVMNAVTQHVSKCWAPRCYENRMYSANFERILQVELFWVEICWHRERWQRRGRSKPEPEFTTEGCWWSGLTVTRPSSIIQI